MTFRQRFEDAQGRVARLNRGEMGERQLEGPGSEARLKKIRKKFRGLTGAPPSKRDKAQLGIGLWLIAWATCFGIAAAIILSR